MPRRKKITTKESKKEKKRLRKPKVPSLGLYRRIVISFIIVTAILIVVILYFSFISATITVIPKAESASTDFIIDVVEATDGLEEGQVNGVFFTKEVEGEKEFVATGSKAVVTEAVGLATIINNYRRPQPLVATTRLLSPDQILLRIKERVDVPVGGSVEVEVYADDPSQLEGRVISSGTHFIIPGLWAALQDDIYAEAKGEIKIGERTVSVVTEEDINQAKQELLDQLELQSFIELGLEGNVAKAVELEEQSVEVSVKPDDEVEKFTVETKAKVYGVFFDKESLLRLAEAKLRSDLAEDKELIRVDYDSLSFSVDNLDIKGKEANVQVHLEGTTTIRLNSLIFDKNNLKGLTKEQVKAHFTKQPSIQSVVVEFFPFWLRTVPQLCDHIEIMINNQ